MKLKKLAIATLILLVPSLATAIHLTRQNRQLYSYPGCTNYNRTVVNLWQGDQWFCSETEALKAGYTRSGDCQSELKGLN